MEPLFRRVSKRARAWAAARGAPKCARAVVAAPSSRPPAAFCGAGCPQPSPSRLRGASVSRRLCGPLPPGADLLWVYVSGDSGGWLPFSVLHEGWGGTGEGRAGFAAAALWASALMACRSRRACGGVWWSVKVSVTGRSQRLHVWGQSHGIWSFKRRYSGHSVSPCLCGGHGSSGGRPVDGASALVRSLGTR